MTGIYGISITTRPQERARALAPPERSHAPPRKYARPGPPPTRLVEQAEDLLDLRDGGLVALAVGAQVGHRRVQQLVDDALGHRLHRLPLLVTQPLEALLHGLGGLGRAHLLHLGLQPRDGGHVLETLLPRLELLQLDAQQHLGLDDLVLSPRLVLGDHLLQVVDVVRLDVAHVVALALDVTRHRDVDEHERLRVLPRRVGLAPYPLGQQRLRDDAARGGGRGEGHVALLHRLPQLIHEPHADVHVGVLGRHLVGARARAVEQRELGDAVRGQVRDEQPRHLAGADDGDARLGEWPVEVGERLEHGELDGGGGDGDGALRDARLRAHELARHDRRVEQPAEHLLGRAGDLVAALLALPAGRDGVRVAGLDLREDLPLADDQRVEPRRHVQQVPHRVAAEKHEEVGPQRLVVQARVRLQIGHGVARRGIMVLGHLKPQGQG
eukprot:scaffold41306_cov56-Phaeocystis_antarctica.AAC.3